MSTSPWTKVMTILWASLGILWSPMSVSQAAEGGHVEAETICDDRVDNDGDSVADCADADCFDSPECQADGRPENTNNRCSDWVDNDHDGLLDCDDDDCDGPGISICQGSWKEPNLGHGTNLANGSQTLMSTDVTLEKGMSLEDLIGRGNDKDGERNDVLCSDGEDNDNDGMVDCADPGCRFDPNVTICQGTPDMRFSVVAGLAQTHDFVQAQANRELTDSESGLHRSPMNTRFNRIQLRTFGPIPRISNSFFLLSMRTEKTPRLTFAMFQIPLGGGHYLNLNSGTGGLSNALIISDSKQILLDAPYYVYNAFEQGNGAAIELGGPIGINGKIRYRGYLAGGTGRFAGNVGGGYFTNADFNYSWSAGGQLGFNLVGFVSRWDNNFLFTPATPGINVAIGAKYDQRSLERYPALNINTVARWNRLVVLGESFTKRELEFQSWQTAYVVQVGYLLIKRKVFLAADYGEFIATKMMNPIEGSEDVKLGNERQWRAAIHYYFYRNIGILSLLYRDAWEEGIDGDPDNIERELGLEAQYRF